MIFFCSSAVMRRLCSGAAQLGVRWNTVRWPTSDAMVWMTWMAVAPVPMMPTRLPASDTPSRGQREVWKAWP